jgi:hypothetical protein
MRPLSAILLVLSATLLASCRGQSEGPIKGVLVVYPDGLDDEAVRMSESLQIHVPTVDDEPVFSYSFVPWSDFRGDLRARRTVLVLLEDSTDAPRGLIRTGDIWSGRDLWARDQLVYAAVPGSCDAAALSESLLSAYEHHLEAWLYRGFVSTSMSSPERMDSLAALGFGLDVPRSYSTAVWKPEQGFIQYQRFVSDEGMLMLSIRWADSDSAVGSSEEAVTWREEMSRRFFYDASADSVDRARLSASPIEVGGASGWILLGSWRNPEHLNAGAFSSYVLSTDTRRYILDIEVYNPGEEKEIYIREGWLIFNTFIPED